MDADDLLELLELNRRASVETRDPSPRLTGLLRRGYVTRKPTARITAGGCYFVSDRGRAAIAAVVAYLNARERQIAAGLAAGVL